MKVKNNRLVILWAIFIFCLHIIPTNNLPKPPEWGISFDKVIHFILFAGLGFLMLQQRHAQGRHTNSQTFVNITLITIFYGFLMECVQILVPGRQFHWIDLTADCLGAVFGNLLFLAFVKLKKDLGQ